MLGPLVAAIATVAIVLASVDQRLLLHWVGELPLGSVLAEDVDDVTAANWTVLRSSGSRETAVIALGASGIREALPDQERILEELRERGIEQIRYLPLFASGESLVESLALLSTVTAPSGSVVVVDLSPGRLSLSARRGVAEVRLPRFALLDYSEVLQVLAEQGHQISELPEIWRARGWLARYSRQRISFLTRRCRVAARDNWQRLACVRVLMVPGTWTETHSFRQHLYPDTALSLAVKENMARRLSFAYRAQGPTSPPFAVAMTRRIEDLCSRRGWRLLWVRLPTDPVARVVERDRQQRLENLLLRASENGNSVLDLYTASFRSDQFYDLHHVRQRGALILTDSILARISLLLRTPR